MFDNREDLVETANPVQLSEGAGISSWATGSGSSEAVLKPRGMVFRFCRGGEGGEERRREGDGLVTGASGT